MSCDFAVWNTEARLTNAEARRLYLALCDGDGSGVSPSPAIDAFYSEITSLHPERSDVPDVEPANWELCPWSADIDRSPGHLIMCCVWPKAGYVETLVRGLAKKHRLALFDPQADEVFYADEPARPFWVRFWQAIREEEDRDSWYGYVLIGVLVLFVTGLEYSRLAEIAASHDWVDRTFARLYRFGGGPAALGAPALLGVALVLRGLRKRLAKNFKS
jgi:hypothetical protein